MSFSNVWILESGQSDGILPTLYIANDVELYWGKKLAPNKPIRQMTNLNLQSDLFPHYRQDQKMRIRHNGVSWGIYVNN